MFQSARIQLTLWYLLIIMLVSVMFSLVIYRMVSGEVDRFARAQRLRIERRFRDDLFFPDPVIPVVDPDLLYETKQHLIMALMVVNGSILVLSGWFGYLLAGRTLRPIRIMVDEQNRFISDSSHELRTPLTSLKSTMEVSLRDKKLTMNDARVLIRESIGEVNTLQLLSDRLLRLAQYQMPNGIRMFERVSVADCIAETVKKLDPIARQKHITFQTECADIRIDADLYGLSELFTILLDNAVKYSPSGKQIVIRADKHDGMAIITVVDEGIGISKKDIPHVFDRFWRADTARTKEAHQGYGLGLSIAKRIVEIHHGTITVTSPDQHGSTFTVRLPVSQNVKRSGSVSFRRNSG